MSMFKDIPVEVGVIYEGERIRRNDMQVELGGPTVKQKFELAKVKPMNEVEDGKEFTAYLNASSLEILNQCKLEPNLANAALGGRYQFERLGYFCVDSRDSKPGMPVFNRTVTLRDTWAKILKAQQKKS